MTRFAHSPEPKARATALACHGDSPLIEVPGLAELDRTAAGYRSPVAYVDLVPQIFGEPHQSVQGCEPATSAQLRFVHAVSQVRQQFPRDMLAVVSHGIVLTLYIAHIRHQTIADVADWRRMGQPDIAIVDPDRAQVVADFGTAAGT